MDNILSLLFYNKKYKSSKFVIENAFGILKKMFKEFQRFKMHVTFIPHMFTCCLIHKFVKFENEESIGRLLHIIELEVVAHGEQIDKNVAIENVISYTHVCLQVMTMLYGRK